MATTIEIGAFGVYGASSMLTVISVRFEVVPLDIDRLLFILNRKLDTCKRVSYFYFIFKYQFMKHTRLMIETYPTGRFRVLLLNNHRPA